MLALRLKDTKAVIASASGREARIVYEARMLAFLSTTTKGIRVHVQHWRPRPQDRLAGENVQAAAKPQS